MKSDFRYADESAWVMMVVWNPYDIGQSPNATFNEFY